MERLMNIRDGKAHIKNYIISKRSTFRIPYCLMDEFITNERHCQRCVHYCGSLRVRCGGLF